MERLKHLPDKKITGILADAQKQWKELKHSDYWLQNNIEYNHNLRIPINRKNIIEKLFNELIPDKSKYREIDQKLTDLEILVSNLLQEKSVSISYNESDWKQTKYNKASYFTIKLIEMLQQKQFIRKKTGYNFPNEKRLTRILIEDTLLKYCKDLPSWIIETSGEVVELRDEKGKLKDYKDTAETWRIRGILKRLNEVNGKSDITLQGKKLNTFLIAIFREKFTLYGRMHTRGNKHYQGYGSDDREGILINGNKTIELDYSGLHPNLLYATEGIQFVGDPYNIIDDRPELRPFLKNILLFMLNSKDLIQAEKVGNYWLFKNSEEKKQLAELGITRAKPFIEKFFEVHKPIAKYFCNGKETGMRIMNKDSKIAIDVVNHFAKQNIPILCVHDSFVVENQYRNELYNTMKTTYKKHTKFEINVK